MRTSVHSFLLFLYGRTLESLFYSVQTSAILLLRNHGEHKTEEQKAKTLSHFGIQGTIKEKRSGVLTTDVGPHLTLL